jgi:hypothetical protein
MRLSLFFDEALESNGQTIRIDPHNFTSHCEIPSPMDGRDGQVQMLSQGDSVSSLDEHSSLADVPDDASYEPVAGSIECGTAKESPGVSTLLNGSLEAVVVARRHPALSGGLRLRLSGLLRRVMILCGRMEPGARKRM